MYICMYKYSGLMGLYACGIDQNEEKRVTDPTFADREGTT